MVIIKHPLYAKHWENKAKKLFLEGFLVWCKPLLYKQVQSSITGVMSEMFTGYKEGQRNDKPI